MKKKILFFAVLTFLFRINMAKAVCDYSTISRAKSLANNINISYSYHIVDDQPYFDVTLNNITPEMYFIDTKTDIRYNYNNTNNGEITITNYSGKSGSYKFYYANGECANVNIGTKYYKFPIYNIYYNSPLCSDIPEFSLCQKWMTKDYSYNEFEMAVYKYKNRLDTTEEPYEEVTYNKTVLDNIVEFYVNYYYYFLILIIVVCALVIYIKRKKDKFKL